MPTSQREVLVAASATIDNLFSGSAFEFMRSNSVISVGATQSATGLVMGLNLGADIVLEEAPIPIKTTYPIIPDEFFYTDVGAQGDRLVLRIRNTTAGALTVRAIAQITPI
jgi:hypothetical protein